MPILKRENDIHPADLLENEKLIYDESLNWWCVYTMSRREKDLMRKLTSLNVPFYAPVIPKRYRSPNGRMRTSFVPLFPNYVFMLGDEEQRHEAMTTNCISTCTVIDDRKQLVEDLRNIYQIVLADVPLTPEARLEPGNRARVRSGHFKGYEGVVLRREGKTRLLVSVQFLEQGVSMEIDEGILEPL